MGKLEHLIGKYLLACSSDDNRLLTQKIQISVLYDSSHLHTFYSAADNIPRAQFPTPRAYFERYLQDFFAVFYGVSFSEGS